MSVHVNEQHLQTAQKLVDKAHAHGGLAPLDLKRFWEDQDKAGKDPFAADCPQAALGVWMSHECVFAELGEPALQDFRGLEKVFASARCRQSRPGGLGLRGRITRFDDIFGG